MPKKIKILHYIPGFKFGGIESRMLDILRHIDREKYQLDFLILTSLDNLLVQEIQSLGCKVIVITHLSPRTIWKHISDIKNVFKENHYDAVHCHSACTGFIFLKYAKNVGIKTRILHSRTSSFGGSSMLIIRKIMKYITVKYATVNFAVSKLAGEWLFGNRQFIVVPNSITIEQYEYNSSYRQKIWDELSINSSLVLGHVGRSSYPKNHPFLLQVFSEVVKKCPDAKLMLVGIEKNDPKIVPLAKIQGVHSNIVYCGYQTNVAKFYSAMDIFLLPSHFEGLPGTAIEAQVSGLPCIISNKVTSECALTNNVTFLNIEKSPQIWAKAIFANCKRDRKSYSQEIKDKGFSIEKTVEMFCREYDKANG